MIIIKGKDKEIKNPVVLAGFTGVGNVGKITIEYLIDTLEPTKYLEIYGSFLPNYIFIDEDGLCDMPKIEFFYLKLKRRNFILVTSDIQPASESKSFIFSRVIFDQLLKYNPKEIVTIGGAPSFQEVKKPRVFGAGTNKRIINKFKKYGVIFERSQFDRILAAAGLLVGFAKIEGIPAVSLLGETLNAPFYLGLEGSKAVIEVLNKAYKLNVDLSGLEKEIEEYKRMLEIQKERIEKIKEVEKKDKKLPYFR